MIVDRYFSNYQTSSLSSLFNFFLSSISLWICGTLFISISFSCLALSQDVLVDTFSFLTLSISLEREEVEDKARLYSFLSCQISFYILTFQRLRRPFTDVSWMQSYFSLRISASLWLFWFFSYCSYPVENYSSESFSLIAN